MMENRSSLVGSALGVTLDGKDVDDSPTRYATSAMHHPPSGTTAAGVTVTGPSRTFDPDGEGMLAGRPRVPEPAFDVPRLGIDLQQLTARIMAAKREKEPTMKTLKTLNDKEHDDWLDAREKYLLDIIDYNERHALQLAPQRVQAFVDRSLWRDVSRGMLPKELRTRKGEMTNVRECTKYFLRTGRYQRQGTRIVGTPIAMLKEVKYVKGNKGTTNIQRWVSYNGKLDDVLDKIPDASRPSDKKIVDVIRGAVKPGVIRRAFADAVDHNMDVGG